MGQNDVARRARMAVGLIAGLSVLAVLLIAPVAAQETPEGTPETPVEGQTPAATGTPEPTTNTVVRIDVVAEKAPVPKGDEIEAHVKVENVEHLAGFDFTITYEPKRLKPMEEELAEPGDVREGVIGARVLDVGQFLSTSPRGEGMVCDDPKADLNNHTVTVSCVTAGPPVCLDGAEGASGSGLLGRVIFESKGGGTATLKLTDTTLVLDDYQVCGAEVVGATDLPNGCLPFRDAPDPSAAELTCEPDGTAAPIVEGPLDVSGRAWLRLEGLGWASEEFLQAEGQVGSIPHSRVEATVELESVGGVPWAVIGPVVGVIVLVLLAGGFLWYRRRGAPSP